MLFNVSQYVSYTVYHCESSVQFSSVELSSTDAAQLQQLLLSLLPAMNGMEAVKVTTLTTVEAELSCVSWTQLWVVAAAATTHNWVQLTQHSSGKKLLW